MNTSRKIMIYILIPRFDSSNNLNYLISTNLVGSLEVKVLAMKVRDPGSNPGQPPLLSECW